MFLLNISYILLFVGQLIFQGQEQCYQYEGCGCPLSFDLSQWTVFNDDIQTGPVLYIRTSTEDFILTSSVIQQNCCTRKDFSVIDANLGISAMKSEECEIIRKHDLTVHNCSSLFYFNRLLSRIANNARGFHFKSACVK